MRAPVIAVALLLAACSVSPPVALYPDLQVPRDWRAYTRDWVRIDAGRVTAARYVYVADAGTEDAVAAAREGLVANGWTARGSQPFTSADGFAGIWADFAKGEDVCRVTVIRGAYATHVDYTLARHAAGGRP